MALEHARRRPVKGHRDGRLVSCSAMAASDGTGSPEASPPEPEVAFAETQAGVGPSPSAPNTGAGGGARPSHPTDEEDDHFVGRVLGGLYQVERKLGEGGMGSVYLVRHVHLQKRFAVKVLAPQIAENRRAVERLHQEAVAASSIDHDNIVDIVNFDVTERDEVFIVMELLDGPSLAQVLETQGALQPERALPIAMQIAAALQAAHERGIVHRDLKPENVMLVRKGGRELVKVLDFGISKVRSAEAEQVRVTRTGQLVGTPLYMSPEQARGEKDVDHRADIYALGVMLYEMLTGSPPFDGANYFQLLWKHGNEQPESPRARNPEADISEALEAVILRAMAKDPSERFQSMADLQEALLHAEPQRALPATASLPGSLPSLAAPAPPADRMRPRRSKARLLGFAAASTVLGLAVAAALWSTRRTTREPAAHGEHALAAEGKKPTKGSRPAEPTAPTPPHEAAEAPARTEEHPPAMEQPSSASIGISFRSEPSGAEVWLGGERLGITPFEVRLPIGLASAPQRFRFRKRGYREATVRADLREGETVSARLRRSRRSSKASSLPIKQEL